MSSKAIISFSCAAFLVVISASNKVMVLVAFWALELPNKTPSGIITAALPPERNILEIRAKNKSSVAPVSIPKSGFISPLSNLPVNGGLAKTIS